MKNSKLIQLLQHFDPQKLQRLQDFVCSPYHNKNKHVIALMNYLYAQAPGFPEASLSKEKVFKAILPGKPYNDLKFRHVQSLLLKVCENFLANEQLQADGISSNLYKLQALNNLGLFKHFYEVERQTRKIQNSIGQFQPTDHLHSFLLNYELEEALIADKGQTNMPQLQLASHQLDQYYLIRKLKMACAEKTYASVYKADTDDKQYDILIDLARSIENASPLVTLYTLGYQTFDAEQHEKAFSELKQQLQLLKDRVPVNEARHIHTLARNYCIRQLNSGKAPFVRELFDLYLIGLEAQALFDEHQVMNPGTYKNIVAVGLRLKEFDWTRQFISTYAAHLTEKYRSDYQTYNLAKLQFELQEYSKAIGLLSQVDYTDVFVGADARTLLLKCYFELSEYEALDALFDSFRQYIERHKELAYHQENYLNTIRFTKRISNLKPKDEKAKGALKAKMAKTAILTERNWLLDKLEALG